MPVMLTIYALIDPNTAAVRYVGRTVNLKARYALHLSIRGKPSRYSPRVAWIRTLKKQHQRPILKILEHPVAPEQGIMRERYWIQFFDSDMLFNCFLPRLPSPKRQPPPP